MSTLSYINHNSNLASSSLNRSLSEVENSIKRLATGEKFAHIGEGVAEKSIASSLSTSLSGLRVGKSNVEQALSILDAAYTIMEDSRNITTRQRDLSIQASSDTLTDTERAILNVEYTNLISQITNNSAFEYNGLTLLDGSYSDSATVNTYQGQQLFNVFDDIDQFSSTGSVIENDLLQTGSGVKAIKNIGITSAQEDIVLTGIVNGGAVTINGQTVFAIVNTVDYNDPTTQVIVGNDDKETIQNLVALLNASDATEISNHSYSLEGDNKLRVSHNSLGFEGNYSSVEVNIVGGDKNGEFVLKGGEDLRERSTAVVKFGELDYAEGETINLNGETFTFRTSGTEFLDTDIVIGGNINLTLDNLVNTVRNSNGKANEAVFEYDHSDKTLTIIHKEAGSNGNSYSFNFGGGTAEYSYESGADLSNVSLNATIEGLVTGNDLSSINASPYSGTKISHDNLTFDQNMHGVLVNAKGFFITGTNSTQNDKFEPNKVQFSIYLNGELYKSSEIALSGGNKTDGIINGSGYKGLGDKIAGGTYIDFQRVGANHTDTGFRLTVKDEGFTLSSTNLDDITTEINALAESIVDGLNSGEKSTDVRLVIDGPSYIVENFGLSSVEKFFVTGDELNNVLQSDTRVTDKIGDVKAQGTIKFTQRNAVDGDQVIVNGHVITFGQHVTVGADPESTRNNLVSYLNSSTNPNVSKAVYYAFDDPSKIGEYNIIVQNKEAGTIGNSFTLGTNNTTTISLNDLQVTETTLGDISSENQKGTQASAYLSVLSTFEGDEDVTLEFFDGTGTTTINIIAPNVVSVGGNNIIQVNGATSNAEAADQIVDGLNDYLSHTCQFIHEGDNQIKAIYTQPGTIGNTAHITSNNSDIMNDITGQFTGGSDSLQQSSNVVTGTNVEQNPNLPITQTLQGAITNFEGVFHEGSVDEHEVGKFEANYVTFSANIGGKVYTSDVVLSGGSITDGQASGSNYNKLGDRISTDSQIVLTANDRSHAVAFSLDQDVDLSGHSKLEVVSKLKKAVADISVELSNASIYQIREVANVDTTKAETTVLEGIRQENIHVAGASFAWSGEYKSLSGFSYDTHNNSLSVNIDGIEYSQVLSDIEAAGGLGDRFDVAHSVIKGGGKTTLILTNSEADDFLSINLQNVKDIDLSTEARANSFVDALNALFSSEGNSGLSFQIGSNTSDKISVILNDIGVNALYRDDEGNVHTDNNILTKEAAIKSSEVLKNALNYLNLEIASVGSVTNQLISIENKLDSIIDSMSDSISHLENISIADASSDYAAQSVKLQAATTAHTHHTSTVRDLVNGILRG